MNKDIDIVIIGLNPGSMLRDCIESARATTYTGGMVRVFYADSGSTDDSLALARELLGSEHVVRIEDGNPSPGAARNLGWRAGRAPLVQFVDSDTRLDPNWLENATVAMQKDVAAVCGKRIESAPSQSVYNWIADLEWNPKPGDCEAFGGDVLVRREVLETTGGYDPELVGGEDPELSQRIRQQGWRIRHIDAAMTTHDLAMHSAAQYRRRAFRTGYAYAAVAFRHGFKKSAFWRYELGRIIVRGGVGLAALTTGLTATTLAPVPGALLASCGAGLVLFPRLLRVGHFQRTKGLDRRKARTYAWHCSLVVIPEFFGVARYIAGHLTNRPLRNSPPRPTLRARLAALTGLACRTSCIAATALATLISTGCSSKFKPGIHELTESNLPLPAEKVNIGGTFGQQSVKEAQTFATEEEIARYSNSIPTEYRIGPGDKMAIVVRERPEASIGNITVSPDGHIAVPRAGLLTVKGRTAEEITEEIRSRLAKYYAEPDVTVIVNEYNNNKAFVLGRVSNPGLVNFTGQGTLLEALSLAGGLPTVAEEAFLSRAMIFRGNDMVIWVDLKEILTNGNIAMNPKLRNNDIVFIPESDDELVYVMGEVKSPGALKLKTELTLFDAVMASGGPTPDAKLAKVYLIRQQDGRGYVQQIRVDKFLQKGDFRQDYMLEDGDIVYVSTKALEKMQYVLSKLSPALRYVDLAVLSALSTSG